MPTGNKKAANQNGRTRATTLRFTTRRLIVVLEDSREVSLPLDWYPTLRRATPAQRSKWISLNDGEGFHWPILDLDLATDALIAGVNEAIPKPPPLHQMVAPKLAQRRRSA